MSMEKARLLFIEESNELLGQMEDHLLTLETAPGDSQALSALFRAAHTIKGSAGVFGHHDITEFMHDVENLLSDWRDGTQAPSRPGIDLVLRCRDHALHLVTIAAAERKPGAEDLAVSKALLDEIAALKSAKTPAAEAPQPAPAVAHDTGADEQEYRISFEPERSVFRMGLDPMGPLRELQAIGAILDLRVDFDALPGISELDAEGCYLRCELTVRATKEQIQSAFEFFDGTARLEISSAGAVPAPEPVISVPATETRLSHVDTQRPSAQPAEAAASRFLRVETGRIDHLVNLVGELVIAGANMAQLAQRQEDPAMQEASAAMLRMIGDLREQSLRVRMVRLGETFNRFHRVVRDLARETGKDVELIVSGGETELDKTVVEKIIDPLMHLVRNAVDHGLEKPDVRVAAGKSASGRIELDAYQETGSIVIEVRDDGRGFAPEKILARAVERGLALPGQDLSKAEIMDFVFQPGFSTAETVSTISGRGVGLDVVRQNIDALRGTVNIDSTPGRGSVMRIRLPLTLAIIEGFQVRIGTSLYIIPMDMILECVDLPENRETGDRRSYMNLRGEILPFVDMKELFGEEGPAGQSIVVVEYGGRRAGLRVASLLGEYQTVIKPMGRLFAHVRGINGATIMGNGTVALILDVPSLIELAVQREKVPVSEAV